MKAALLPDRGVVKVTGNEARKLLNGLVTSDLGKVAPARPAFAALLTPQGKIIADFIIVDGAGVAGDDFHLDCPRPLAPALVERLKFYKLRAKVAIEDISGAVAGMAFWNGGAVASRRRYWTVSGCSWPSSPKTCTISSRVRSRSSGRESIRSRSSL